jgi:REP element-mobilizing transposase RayT
MHRGIERRSIFSDAHDYRHFLGLLGETVERYRVRIHAYCLLGNHYHAILQTPDANLSQSMQWLGLSYSTWFNARHDRVGPLFQGRFKSVPVEEGSWVQELSIYLHLNPVRTIAYGLDKSRRSAESQGLTRPTREQVTARLKKLREYRWSSYRTYAGYESGPEWLTSTEILRRSARKVGDRSKNYRAQLRQILSHGVEESRMDQFRDKVGIGSAKFLEQIKNRAGDGARETERRGRLRNRVTFKDIVTVIETLQGEPIKDWLHLHGDARKWMALKLARQYTGMTLAQLGDKMGGMDYAAVGMGLIRFQNRLQKDTRLKKKYTQAIQMLDVKT